MDPKLRNRLQKAFEKCSGRIGVAPDMPPDMIRTVLEGLLECPDCRAAVLEACNADDRRNVDIDAVMRDLILSPDHQAVGEIRRHFDVTDERLDHRIDLVVEGVAHLDQKLDRRIAEVREEMERGFAGTQAMIKSSTAELDRRLRTLEA